MAVDQSQVDVYIETGQKRALAVALDWPGWCRSGRDDSSALEALLQAAPRLRCRFSGQPARPFGRLSGLTNCESVSG